MSHLATISQNQMNKILLRETDVLIDDGSQILNLEFFGNCNTEDPFVFPFLAMVCNGMVQLEVNHTCEVSPDVTFNLDVGIYTVLVKEGVNIVHTFYVKII